MSGEEVLPKMPTFSQIPFYTLKHPKIQKNLHFRKVHARSYKKHIYRFFISPIVQKIFAKEEKLKGWYSPLSSDFILEVPYTAILENEVSIFKNQGHLTLTSIKYVLRTV